MCRTAIIALVLAALFVNSANGSPARPAKTHSSATANSPSHKKTHHLAAHTRGNAAQRSPAPKAGHAAARKRRPAATTYPAPSRQPSKARPATPTFAPGLPASAVEASLKKGIRAKTPPPMRGSYQSLERQNEKSEADGLERIEDGDDLSDRIAHKLLVPVPVSAALTINGNLPLDRRYCRPWTAQFLIDLGRAHSAQFHRPLEVSSAVRTVEYQRHLMGSNGNAAAAEGDIVSPHITGATVDIAKQGLTRQQVGWMRARLLPLQQAGKIDVEEEFRQACFHITVYRNYAPPPEPRETATAGKPGQGKASKPGKQIQLPVAPGRIISHGR